ncbi:hypothetical protein HK098_003517 [Nowakowskiella sp. JEL0407]|nr:hypothetical protein HK098_003517 [Nowakowskiella sp. JEL0407]
MSPTKTRHRKAQKAAAEENEKNLPDVPIPEQELPASNQPEQKKHAKQASLVSIFLFAVIFSLVVTAGVSYMITDTFTFGILIPNLRRYLPKREVTFTPQQLLQYDGSDESKPIYLAILGKVYDVTAGKSTYGKGGGYNFFAGREGARAFSTGCFKTHLTHDLRGLTEQQINDIKEWAEFYEKSEKYFYVGKLLNPPIDSKSPTPEPC